MKNKMRWIALNLEEIIAGVGLTGMLIFTIFNVMMRYIFGQPKGWATEIAVICLVWATFPGAAACFKKNLHYGMDFLIIRLPSRIQSRLRQFLMGVCVILFVFLAVMAILFTFNSSKKTSYFMISYRYVNSAAIVGFLSMALYSCYFFILSFWKPEQFNQYHAISYEEPGSLDTGVGGDS